MNILVTNDDGIDSPGVWALAEAMNRVGETLIVAPDKEQSGVGTSVSLHSGMSVVEVSARIQGVRAYAIGGTPSDCVTVGLRRLAQRHIDLIASGINLGANVGNDILYSGTVMATLQGYFRNIPSIAVSLVPQSQGEEPRFDGAAKVAECLALGMKRGTLPTGAILNANVPNIPPEQMKGITITRAAPSGYIKVAEIRDSGHLSYSLTIDEAARLGLEEGTDIWAITTGFISITPLRPTITDLGSIPPLVECIPTLESDLRRAALDGAE